VRLRLLARGLSTWASAAAVLAAFGSASAGPTNLAQTTPLIWVMLAISVAGAIITWGVMAYALWKFRDPATKKRRYG
jgi:hypothetical protein